MGNLGINVAIGVACAVAMTAMACSRPEAASDARNDSRKIIVGPPAPGEMPPLYDIVARIRIGKDAIYVDDKRILDLSDGKIEPGLKRDGTEGLFVVPLYEALTKQLTVTSKDAKKQGGKVLLIADGETSYRVVTEVLYSAGQAGYDNDTFVFECEGELELPSIPPAAPTKALNLFVLIGEGGFVFKVNPAFVLPWMGQASNKEGPDILNKNGLWDWAGLAARLRELKRAHPTETTIIIGANDSIPFKMISATMTVARGTRGERLFPLVTFTRGVSN